MVNKYTANKRLRSEDAYTPDGRHDMRPEYPSIVYTQILKKIYPDVPVILGGIEASLRRVTHYDYWQDCLRKSILIDSGADLLIYGMGEKPITELCKRMKEGKDSQDGAHFIAAEGAGQHLLQQNEARDASGNPVLSDVVTVSVKS